jgi:hypothetical protein
VGGAQQCRVRKPAELFGHGGIDLRNAMAEQIAPQSRSPIEKAPAAVIDKVMTLGSNDDKGIGREILAHLCKRMPYMIRIPPSNILSAWRQGSDPDVDCESRDFGCESEQFRIGYGVANGDAQTRRAARH